MRSSTQEDYLLRMIRQIAQAILRIAGLKQRGQLDEARDEVHNATAALLRPYARTVSLLDPVSAADIIGDPDRVLAWARLLAESAELDRLQGDVAGADRERARALALAREATRRGVADVTLPHSSTSLYAHHGRLDRWAPRGADRISPPPPVAQRGRAARSPGARPVRRSIPRR